MAKLSTKAMRLYMRKKRAARREQGMCVQCGARKAKKGRVSCGKCLKRRWKDYVPAADRTANPPEEGVV